MAPLLRLLRRCRRSSGVCRDRCALLIPGQVWSGQSGRSWLLLRVTKLRQGMTQNAHPVKSLPASPQKSANGTREGFRENSVCIFVDFENVGVLDLAPIENRPVKVDLLLGEQQKNL